MELLTKTANQGYANSEHKLYALYEWGFNEKDPQKCINPNPKAAFFWLQRYVTNRQENEYDLAVKYRDGIGTEPDPVKAFEHFKNCSEKGNKQAKFELACCYRDGRGVQQNFFKAFELFTDLERHNHAAATYEIALCYEEGRGILNDPQQALHYLQKSEHMRYEKAKFLLACKLRDGKGVDINVTCKGALS